MKENYKPWEVRIEDFPQRGGLEDPLRFLINFAILAPSSHNSQPWAFKIQKNTISVFVEPERRLVESDINDRQLYISLGCAITNIAIAADYFGFSTTISYLPDIHDKNLVATIFFTRSTPRRDADHLIFSIPRRVNNRNRYEARLPEKNFLNKIQSFATPEIEISIVNNLSQKDALADIALDAGVAAMGSKGFRQELSKYVKSNITNSKIGMPAFGMGIPTPISFVVSTMIRHLNMNKIGRKKDEQLLKKFTPLFVVISTKEDNRNSWLKAGEIYEHIALLATHAGLRTAVWAAPIQIGEFYKDIERILNTTFRPQVFFRIGYTKKKTPHSPRLTSEEVTRVVS